jgi:hypothetical protein
VFTLTSSIVGTYAWTASYSGDANNNGAKDQGGSAEQTVISPASPGLDTTASLAGSILTDSAILSGGLFPTGSILFTLTGPGGFSFTETETASGNGTYTADTTLPTFGPVDGTYVWAVSYSELGAYIRRRGSRAVDMGDDDSRFRRSRLRRFPSHRPPLPDPAGWRASSGAVVDVSASKVLVDIEEAGAVSFRRPI